MGGGRRACLSLYGGEKQVPPAAGRPFQEFIVSCDYGTVNPASFGLWGRREGVWYRLKEYYYDSKRDGGPKTDEEHYQGLIGLLGTRKPRCVIVDPSAASFQEVIRRHGRIPGGPGKKQRSGWHTPGVHRVEGRALSKSACPVRTVFGNSAYTAGTLRETRIPR